MKLLSTKNLKHFYKPESLTFILIHDNMLFSQNNHLENITNQNFLIQEHYFNIISKKEIKLLEKILQMTSFETFITELNSSQ